MTAAGRHRRPWPVRRLGGVAGPGPAGVMLAGAVLVTVAALLLSFATAPAATSTTWPASSSTVEPAPVLRRTPAARLPTSTGLARALGPRLSDRRLGPGTGASVVDATTGRSLYETNAGGARPPGSTTKLCTATAVLAARGPGYRLTTTAVTGAHPDEVVLVGGGDPTLSVAANGAYPGAARLTTLAFQVRRAWHGRPPTRVVIDADLFTGPTLGPGWGKEISADGSGAQVTSLMVDGGRTAPHYDLNRSRRPDLDAGRKFAQLLGIPASRVTRGAAPAGARRLGRVLSPPLSHLVETMLRDGDNVLAEALARQVALAVGQPASFGGAARAVRSTLAGLGLPVAAFHAVDGSGLSARDRLSATFLTRVLSVVAGAHRPALSSIFSGLPVAGFSGNLQHRYSGGDGRRARGVLRARTGIGSGSTALAGYVLDADGRMLAFAMIAEGGSGPEGRATGLDDAAATLAGCGCG
ncbi:MAG: D-alanyl-D-alanine carboxypeptidase/D-alanyl-D-alanine-endopeptidase, partial [Actinocatenispora sp.]